MLPRPPEPIVREALVDHPYRWCLSRTWDGAKPKLVVIGCNPSYANAERDDPTMWVVMKFAFAWGYGGVKMLNVYPLITPVMQPLNAWIRGESGPTAEPRRRNTEAVARELADLSMVIAAWGNLVKPSEAIAFIGGVEMLLQRPVQLHCFGTTNTGAPKHPMARGHSRIPNDQQPVRWAISARV
jgi:hypothetical protein